MLKSFLWSAFLFNLLIPTPSGQSAIEVEIFDIKQGEVVQTVPAYLNVQDEVISYLDNITGVYKKINPIPHDGMMVKIPLEQPYLLKNEWLSNYIEEVIIIFPKNDNPILLLFDEENSPYFFHFNGDMFFLLEKIELIKEGLNVES